MSKLQGASIREALAQGARSLELSGVPNPRLTAESLLAHTLGVDRTYLYTHDDRILTPEESRALEESLTARTSGTPLQHIVGRQEFFGRPFIVNGSVLIPRPETELIIETVLERTAAGSAPRILDIGTGSGAIAITLALELPKAEVFATDISLDALGVARQNAAALHAQVSFAAMDLAGALAPADANTFDWVVSNPPYVDPNDAPTLAPEVRDHEPALALFAEDNGLEVIRRLVPEAWRLLKPGGYLLVEIGAGMDKRVLKLFDDRWIALQVKPDLQGIPRTVVAQRSFAL